jgi:L-asparaginase
VTTKPKIAFIASSNATVLSTPPLVTSNKARAAHGLPLRRHAAGTPPRFDPLRPQRLAAPAVVYVEQFSAHPLERDAADLYGPPDGYIDGRGDFHPTRVNADDKPVFRIELRPEDGLYPLPYMATQADGSAWDYDGAGPLASRDRTRQPFFPDGHRLVEEIDRLAIGYDGSADLVSALADIDFHRVAPSSGYAKGLAESDRTDVGRGDIAPETAGVDYFPYRPPHLAAHPLRKTLAVIVNAATRILGTTRYDGVLWAQGSPRIEETLYWLSLLLDTDVPICGVAAQRSHQQVSADGPKNILDAVTLIASRVWSDDAGGNRLGAVLVADQQIYAARDVQKGDARPGGYVATGGHGGIVGGISYENRPVITYVPAARHTRQSHVNLSRLPDQVQAVRKTPADARPVQVSVPIKAADGSLVENAIPHVAIVKDGNYRAEGPPEHISSEADVLALLDTSLNAGELAGFVVEGLSPYGTPTSQSRLAALRLATCHGMPVVQVGRGNNEGFSGAADLLIGGGNLTATKARLLLMACLMRFGSLPTAKDPSKPDSHDLDAIRRSLAAYQQVFDTH